MPRNTQSDLRTLAYVMRRTNYGEADRILNLITPEGKVAVIAKSVRREKSKLAGAVEMFSLIDINIHRGRSELGVVTGAKMLKYYGGILKDFDRMELAGTILRRVNAVAENMEYSSEAETPEYFRIVDSCLKALDAGAELQVVESWFWFNLIATMGEQINLYFDVTGKKLSPEVLYEWDFGEMALKASLNGMIDAEMIKLMRLLLSSDLEVVLRVKSVSEKCEKILRIARAAAKV